MFDDFDDFLIHAPGSYGEIEDLAFSAYAEDTTNIETVAKIFIKEIERGADINDSDTQEEICDKYNINLDSFSDYEIEKIENLIESHF